MKISAPLWNQYCVCKRNEDIAKIIRFQSKKTINKKDAKLEEIINHANKINHYNRNE